MSTLTCGELSCDECNDRTVKLTAKLAAEKAKVRILRAACDRISEKWCVGHDSNPFAEGNAMMGLADKALAETEESP